jgi:endonuclease/exonuclease/phosphatase family metal-dependent hydrolase
VSDAQAASGGLRIATYNIHASIGRDGRHDTGRIAHVINELAADVVALQEVQSRHAEPDALEFLAAETGMTGIPGITMFRQDGSYGNALLTRMPLLETQPIDLSFPRREPRGAIDVTVAARGERLRIVATHLGLRPAERRHQIDLLLARIDRDDPTPTALMGDLNEWFLWGRPLRRLHRRFGETPAPPTFPSRRPLFALDRMWVKPLDRLRRLAVHDSPLARCASDHLPLVADLHA